MDSKEYEKLPENIKSILNSFDENDGSYNENERISNELEKKGYLAVYGLDGSIYSVSKNREHEKTYKEFQEKVPK